MACGNESKEDIIDLVEEHMNEVEKYYTEVALEIRVLDADGHTIDQKSGVMRANRNDKTSEADGEITQDGQTQNLYSTDGTTYRKVANDPWESTPSQDDPMDNAETNYESASHILMQLKDEADIDMEKKNSKYIITFSGKNEDIYNSFKGPYSLDVAGAVPKDVNHDLEIIIDNETYFIEKVSNQLTVEVEGHTLETSIDQTFEQINEIDDIEIPQEVFDEAETTVNSEKNIDEDIASTLSQIEDNIEEVKSYSMMRGLVITVLDTLTEKIIDESEETSTSEVIEDPLEVNEVGDLNGEQAQFYTSEHVTYTKFPGEGWQDMTDQDEVFRDINTKYKDIAQIIFTVGEEDGTEMEVDDDGNILFTFTGKSEAIYSAFQAPFNLSLTGVEPKDLEQNIRITVNSETNFIEQIENMMHAQAGQEELHVEITQTYENMNEIDAIEVPQEAIDETS